MVNTKNNTTKSKKPYWEIPKTYGVKKAFENLQPPCQRIRNSLNRMQAEGRQDRRIEDEYAITEKLLDLTSPKNKK